MKLAALLLLLPAAALAKPASFTLDHFGSFKIDVPTGWTALEKRMRAPLMLAAPMPEGQRFRTILSVYPVEGLNGAQVSDALDGTESGYHTAKDAWVKEKGGEVETYRKPTAEDWPHVKGVKHLGVTYNLNGNRFEESSFYFSCRGKPLHVKVLRPIVSGGEKDAGAVEKTLRSISCDN